MTIRANRERARDELAKQVRLRFGSATVTKKFIAEWRKHGDKHPPYAPVLDRFIARLEAKAI